MLASALVSPPDCTQVRYCCHPDPVSNSTSALCDCNIRHRDQMRDVTPVRIEDWCNVRGIMEQRFQVRIA
jgi:hypothetical protein